MKIRKYSEFRNVHFGGEVLMLGMMLETVGKHSCERLGKKAEDIVTSSKCQRWCPLFYLGLGCSYNG